LFAGGDLSINVTAVISDKESKYSDNLYDIKGKNPDKSDVLKKLGTFPATNIACWESAHSLAQFDSENWPLFGPPNGWGIMQIDTPPSKCPLKERTIWDWTDNVAMGLCTINGKGEEARAYINNVYNDYPDAPEFPETIVLNGISYNAFTIDVIKRYNGGKYFGYNSVLNQWIIVNEGPNPNYVQNVLNANCE